MISENHFIIIIKSISYPHPSVFLFILKTEKILEELLRKSEQALSYVKDRGRSHYRFYQEEMNSAFPDEALMESHLRRAIELDELTFTISRKSI